jgi:hypothetical protein
MKFYLLMTHSQADVNYIMLLVISFSFHFAYMRFSISCCQNALGFLLVQIYNALVVADETNEEDEEMLRALAASTERMEDSTGMTAKDKDVTVTVEEKTCSIKKLSYPPLPEEPKGDRNLLCRVGFRLPDGRRVQRNFFRTDSIQVRTF